MAAVLTEKLIYEILAVVEEIPEGKVSTYGRIAELIGREKNSRMVGKVMVSFSIKRSTWASGKGYVPSCSMGCCVASTQKGSSSV